MTETKQTTHLTPLQKEVWEIVKLHTTESKDRKHWIQDLAVYGCVSGMVNNLIYYQQTERFFNQHEDEILEPAGLYNFRPDIVDLGMMQLKNTLAGTSETIAVETARVGARLAHRARWKHPLAQRADRRLRVDADG